jgi:hypothetical protein
MIYKRLKPRALARPINDLEGRGRWADGLSANFTNSSRWESFASVTIGQRLKVFREGSEAVELDEALRRHGLGEIVVLKHPGIGVMHVDGVQAGGEGRVDIGTRTVTNHPCGVRRERVASDDLAIGVGMLLGRDLDGGEVHVDAGAVELFLLLARIAFGNQDESMPLG